MDNEKNEPTSDTNTENRIELVEQQEQTEESLEVRVNRWLAQLSEKEPSAQLAEIAQTYVTMLQAAEMAVNAENKIHVLDKYIMALVHREADSLVISDKEIENLDGILSIKRTLDGKGTLFSIRPHPPETLPS